MRPGGADIDGESRSMVSLVQPEGDVMGRVLVAVDGSTHAAEALRWAVSFADPEDIDVLHVFTVPVVVPVVPVARTELYPIPDIAELTADAHRFLRGWVEETVPAVAGSVTYHVREGGPARRILDLAEERDAQVIVVGNRGLGGVRGVLLGSVSRQVAEHARCTVVIVPGDGELRPIGGEIVVGVDGSPASRAALRWASALSDRVGGKIVALAIVGLGPATQALVFAGRPEPVTDYAHLQARADELLQTAIAEELGENGERVIREVAVGYAASTLLERAAVADVLVVGSRGIGGFERLLLGSVSHHCASHAPCPVVIVPDPDRE